MSTCLRSRFRKREREKKIEGRRKGVDTVKSNAEACVVCARTSTKPPKGRRRRNSQSRSSVPCVIRERKKCRRRNESQISFFFVQNSLWRRGGEKRLFELSNVCRCRRRRRKKTRVVQKSASSSSSSSSSLPLLSLHFLFFLFFPESRVFLHLRHVPAMRVVVLSVSSSSPS